MASPRKDASEIDEADRLDGFLHPRETADITGHEDAVAELAAAIATHRLHHAWLLSGPTGIGKATLAYRAARVLLKHGAGGMVPERLHIPGNDPVFRSLATLTHPDFFVLRRPWDYDARPERLKTIIPVEEVRKAASFFSRSAGEGGWRVCIVDSVDEMNANAANALLKILEEPPPRALFLLISHSPGRLLPTIRSRCRKLPMLELPDADILRLLAAQMPELPAADRLGVVKLAAGSIGRALSLASEDGMNAYRDMIAMLVKLPQLDIAGLHALGDRLARPNAEAAYVNLTGSLRDWIACMIRDGAAGRQNNETVAGEADLMRRLFGSASLDQWLQVWENITALLISASTVNLGRKQVILSIFSSLAETARGR